MRSTKYLCGLLASVVILGACSNRTSGENREISGEVKVPGECISIFNFGYNAAQAKYFVSCKKEDKGYSFYARDAGRNDWIETKFITTDLGNNNSKLNSELSEEVQIPVGCNKLYNFGYNYATSKQFVACQKEDQGFSFYIKKLETQNWKEVKFMVNGKYLKGE